jgi:hypothetical protein
MPLLLAFYKALLGAVEISRVPEDGLAFYVGQAGACSARRMTRRGASVWRTSRTRTAIPSTSPNLSRGGVGAFTTAASLPPQGHMCHLAKRPGLSGPGRTCRNPCEVVGKSTDLFGAAQEVG